MFRIHGNFQTCLALRLSSYVYTCSMRREEFVVDVWWQGCLQTSNLAGAFSPNTSVILNKVFFCVLEPDKSTNTLLSDPKYSSMEMHKQKKTQNTDLHLHAFKANWLMEYLLFIQHVKVQATTLLCRLKVGFSFLDNVFDIWIYACKGERAFGTVSSFQT